MHAIIILIFFDMLLKYFYDIKYIKRTPTIIAKTVDDNIIKPHIIMDTGKGINMPSVLSTTLEKASPHTTLLNPTCDSLFHNILK